MLVCLTDKDYFTQFTGSCQYVLLIILWKLQGSGIFIKRIK